MTDVIRHVLWLNPEPWAVGTISPGRKNGKIFSRMSPDPNLVAFQNAVKETLGDDQMLPKDFVKLTFFFWRQQAVYLDAADRRRHRNRADATNLQKGLEDALQGILIENDRDVLDIRSVIMEQGPNVEPAILIQAEKIDPFDPTNVGMNDYMYQALRKIRTAPSNNQWPPRS